MIKQSVLECIGNTPIIHLNKIEKKLSLKFNLFAKVESFNPGFSIKDRTAYQMLKDALDENKINQDSTIVEATSGNTGIGLALVCCYLKLKLIIVMPENMSKERIDAMRVYSAKVILTEKEKGMKGATELAEKLLKENKNYFSTKQFENPSNIKAHYITGKEIIEQLPTISCFVAGFGTGGTISGVSKVLKEYNKNIKVCAVEPASSPLLTKGYASSHKIAGIGANFIPKNLKRELIDEIIDIEDDKAYDGVRLLLNEEALFCGISSGASVMAAIKKGIDDSLQGKDVLCILPDSGSRYLSIKGLYFNE